MHKIQSFFCGNYLVTPNRFTKTEIWLPFWQITSVKVGYCTAKIAPVLCFKTNLMLLPLGNVLLRTAAFGNVLSTNSTRCSKCIVESLD